MTRLSMWLPAIATMIPISPQAAADQISFSYNFVQVTREASVDPNGAPFNGNTHQFFVTTDADILSVNDVLVTLEGGAELYFNIFGRSDHSEPGKAVLIPTFPAVAFDSWVTTPGPTNSAGAPLPGDGSGDYFDTTVDGAQTDFQFAQLTVPRAARGYFTGSVSIASTMGSVPYTKPFVFRIAIPEPAAVMLAAPAVVAFALIHNRQRPPSLPLS